MPESAVNWPLFPLINGNQTTLISNLVDRKAITVLTVFLFLEIKSDGFWGITVESLTSNNVKEGKSFPAILDTGTTLLLLPDDIIARLAKQYSATAIGGGSYSIPCDASKLRDLIFTIGGSTFKVPASDLIFSRNQDGTCDSAFGSSGLPFAILGDVFLKNNYVIFDVSVPQVQIAPMAVQGRKHL